MQEASEALLQIADCDRQALFAKKKLESLPAKRAKIRRAVDRIESQVAQVNKKTADLKAQIKMRSRLMEVEREKIEVANKRLMEVNNQKEYSAIQKELDTATRTIKKVEDQILEIEESMEPLDMETSELSGQLKEASRQFEIDDQVFKLAEKEGNQIVTNAVTTKDALQSQVDEETWTKYLKLMKRGLVPGAVKISEPFCNGCAASLLAQVYNEIIRAGHGECSSCRRLLYYEAPEAVEEPVVKKKKAAAKTKTAAKTASK